MSCIIIFSAGITATGTSKLFHVTLRSCTDHYIGSHYVASSHRVQCCVIDLESLQAVPCG